MVLNILNKNLEDIGNVSSFIKLEISRKYTNVSPFTLDLPLDLDILNLIEEENIFYFGKEIETEAYIMESINLKNVNGIKTIQVKGRNASCKAKDRIISYQLQYTNTPVGDIVNEMYKQNIISPVNADRKISNIQLGGGDKGSSVAYQNRGGYILDQEIKLCETDKLGFTIKLDTKNKVFKHYTYKGTDRSVNQSSVNPVIFSSQLKNLSDENYTRDVSTYKNVAYVAGEGEDAARTIIVTNNEIVGSERRELWVDARDLQSKSTVDGVEKTLTAEEYNALLNQRGKEKLVDCQKINTFTGKVDTSSFEYNKHWFLGDIVTIQNQEWGVSADIRIEEVKESYDLKGATYTPVLGDSKANILQRLFRKVSG